MFYSVSILFCKCQSHHQAIFPSYFLSQCPTFFVRNITLHYDYLTSIEFQPKLWYIGFSQRWRGPVLAPIRADQTGPSPVYGPSDEQAHDKGAILMVTYVRVNPLAFLLILSLFHIFLSLIFLFLYFSILYFPLLYYPVLYFPILYFPILYYPVLYFPALNPPLHVHPISSYLKYLHLIIHCSNFPSYP